MLTGDQGRAEDLLQEVLADLARRWDRVSAPEAYVRRALYHRRISWWRSHLQQRSEIVTEKVSGRRAEIDHADAVGDRLLIVEALRRLTPRQRAVLALRYLEDLSESEVAAQLGCSVGAVRSQTYRSIQRLRQLAPELSEMFDQGKV